MYLYKLPRTRFFLILFTYFLLSNFSTFHHLQSILHLVSWFRVILDEAHMIKDRSTSTAKAVFNLNSLNKWCLSGTPLQNRVGELYSLVRFLRIDPHAFYYCKRKDCGCKSLHYRSVSPKIKVSLSLSLSSSVSFGLNHTLSLFLANDFSNCNPFFRIANISLPIFILVCVRIEILTFRFPLFPSFHTFFLST